MYYVCSYDYEYEYGFKKVHIDKSRRSLIQIIPHFEDDIESILNLVMDFVTPMGKKITKYVHCKGGIFSGKL